MVKRKQRVTENVKCYVEYLSDTWVGQAVVALNHHGNLRCVTCI